MMKQSRFISSVTLIVLYHNNLFRFGGKSISLHVYKYSKKESNKFQFERWKMTREPARNYETDVHFKCWAVQM